MKKSAVVFVVSLLLSTVAFAQNHFSYDVSGSSGSRDGESYSEIHLGLNYYATNWLNWRNSLFTQFGSEIKTVYGLDSAALLNYDLYTQNRAFGVEFFAGPGVRLATEKSNAVFGKAGITFGLGGLRIGGGVQAFHYLEDRTDKNDFVLGKDEVQYFITLSGGGTF
ncbi:MAG: hypothetical protein OM95_10075 [Bdellovibrio sp. ArHS]|uniref:hypothetical protein n=1 Tax=Bdellovibrio sp. ArHS TaxID=1569284 RepID=UPI0005828BA7|nr:hypothetical protein [Bdellovibrio sp. ArHS]KHD88259.1 MAG: hypothetical protein OM95_10075 [Bdellovibrio sp. ArHS]